MQRIEAARLEQAFDPRSSPAILVVPGRVRLDAEGCSAKHRGDRHGEHTPNHRGNAVRAHTQRRTCTALGVVTLCLTVACGGGPAGTLYDLIADASDNAEVALNNLENARGEVEAATSVEAVRPCAETYRRPEGMHWRPRYADSVPIPEGINPDRPQSGSMLHRVKCNATSSRLESIRALYETMISSLTEFDLHAEIMLETIDRLDDAAIDALVGEIDAIAAARPDEDTFMRRHQRLVMTLLDRSPVVKIFASEVESQEMIFALTMSADDAANVHETLLAQIDDQLREHEVARQYLQNLYDYRRQTYEGPDAGAEP